MTELPPAVRALSERLADLRWVADLWVAGSLATADYIPGVSDLDLVATVDGPIDAAREANLAAIHKDLDQRVAAGAALGCVYLTMDNLADRSARRPTWTHGKLIHRALSGISRAELVLHGFAVYGRPPHSVFPPMSEDEVRHAARSEICGYWAWASRRPHMWLSPVIADLGLTSMARGRFALREGSLLTKSQAIEQAHAPAWLIDQLRIRRRGEAVSSPRLRTAWIAWRDARRTVRDACRGS